MPKCGRKYMSRIGKVPIKIPESVSINISGHGVDVAGPKGKLCVNIPDGVEVKLADSLVKIESKQSEMQGMVKMMIANAVTGVTEGWKKTLELSGTGFRAAVAGNNLQMALGFSHPVNVVAPEGVAFEVKENKITVSGCDKGTVGQTAAIIRGWKPADPYKAKGLKYEGEVIIRKAGKAAKAGGAVAGK